MAFKKDPNAVLDYTVDWTAWLGTDTIVDATWLLSAGLTEVTKSRTTTAATVLVEGGVSGTDETATCRITTAAGRVDDRTITLTILER